MFSEKEKIPTVVTKKDGMYCGVICGTIIIAKHDGNGNTVGIDGSIPVLMRHVGYLYSSNDDDVYPVLNID